MTNETHKTVSLLNHKTAYLAFTDKLSTHANTLQRECAGSEKKDILFRLEPIYVAAAELIMQFPQLKNDVVQAIIKLLPGGLGYVQVNNAIDVKITELEEQEANQSVKLAPSVQADFEIEELLPSTIASVIRRDCGQTNARELATMLMLMVSVGSLLGSRVQLLSGVKRKPMPPNLYFLVTGNSSTNKTVGMAPVVDAMTALQEDTYREYAQRKEAIQKSSDEQPRKKEALEKLERNKADHFYEVSSFSPEGLAKILFSQNQRAGLHVHRDEASGLFSYKKWSGGGGSAGSAGDSSTDLFSNILITGHTQSLKNRSFRVASEKDLHAKDQTISISGCLQDKYLQEILDFGIDNNGWTARWVMCRANAGDGFKPAREVERSSPIGSYMHERIIPFCLSVCPVNKDTQEIESLELEFSEDAKAAYRNMHDSLNQTALALEQQGIEPAYCSYLRKGQVRILKFALILHVLDRMKDAHVETKPATKAHPYVEYGFAGTKRVDTPVEIETLLRAQRLDQMLLKEYQEIATCAFTAKQDFERAHETQEQLQKITSVIGAIQRQGTIRETDLKTKLRTRKLSNKQITEIVRDLIQQQCISAVPDGKSFLLSYEKSLRD